MVEVTLAKAAFYPLDSRIVHRSGTVLEVSKRDAETLRKRGVLVEPEPEPEEAEAVEADAEAESGEDEAEEAEEEPEPEPVNTGDYPPLPDKTAAVGVWKQYAQENGIKLTGLSKRNEIMGYITKTVSS